MPPNNFTLVRLILATMVVFGHFKTLPGLSPAHGLYSYADFAVDAFFVVSGYLVYGSFDNSPQLKGFYIKRFFRIYPLYLVMILLQMLVMLMLLGKEAQIGDTLKYLGSNLVFANFISPDIGGLLAGQHNPAINPSLWTLKIEAGFYLLVPLLWWLVKKAGIIVVPVIYIASTIFAAVAFHYGYDTLAKQLPGQLRFFVVGIAIYLYCHPAPILPKKGGRGGSNKCRVAAMSIIAIILFTICSLRHVLPLMPIYPLLVGALVFICVLRLPAIPLKLDMSYGVYLIHAPLIQLALFLGFFEDSNRFLLLLLAVVYILAFIVEKTIEIPMVKYGKKLSGRFSGKREAKKA